INIEDAHSSISAQKQIAEIFQSLVGKYNLSLIGVEGTTGPIDTSMVSSFPIKDVRKQVAESLLAETAINASEFFHMVSDENVELMGIEDQQLYEDNIKTYADLLNAQQILKPELIGLHQIIGELESKVFSSEVVEYRRLQIGHRDGAVPFTEYWKMLEKIIERTGVDYSSYTHLNKLVQTAKLEAEIDFEKANQERDQLVNELKSKLTPKAIEDLTDRALQFKLGKTTPGNFHAHLVDLAKEYGISPLPFEDFILYAQYAVVYEQIDLITVFNEIEQLESGIEKNLYVSKEEKQFAEFTRVIQVLTKFLETKLSTNDEFYYRQHEKQFEISSIRAYLDELVGKYGIDYKSKADLDLLNKFIPSADKFYRQVKDRNDALLSNL
ncbi:MAG: hypothetical protein KC649_07950, partial [Candidatus Omnitrophica bacterium]|nr:hypothetical protein [Candidatus Omnitrophota bacterium]